MSAKKIKTIFMGTPDFAVPGFKALLDDDSFEIIMAITQPDKKIGRRHVLSSPPIKIIALKNNIPILQPKKITTIYNDLHALSPDLIVDIAYSQILPKNILNLPKYGAINVHASLLPKYRGAACIQAAILSGDKESGISIMKMDSGLDTGPIIKQEKVLISSNDTGASLFEKLSALSAKILPSSIKNYINSGLITHKQTGAKSYAPQLKKEDGLINWSDSAEKIERFVRAMSPWPGAFTFSKNKLRIKILSVEKNPIKLNDYPCGTLFYDDKKLLVQCGQYALVIKTLQPAGKKVLSANDFRQGYKNLLNSILK